MQRAALLGAEIPEAARKERAEGLHPRGPQARTMAPMLKVAKLRKPCERRGCAAGDGRVFWGSPPTLASGAGCAAGAAHP